MGDEDIVDIIASCCRPSVELEDYACEGCRNDGNTHMGCGDCPHNEYRKLEWREKFIKY